ncbi:glycosyltransferase family 2 protein [Mucilaginibacter sp. UR6-11]|uniref:glycosyltransferase n=1 Tax=Mucilaginibacter sp. UR6-11 TaxID=1435644 RepID=UPI001E61256D|nr:glycosyltransferase family 2 protein [Mucilaginibacter sp. UR6-11]MCC8425046.1 glycosyltransferase family 2 protein [Mucilaginibacter sp. UR6-11]
MILLVYSIAATVIWIGFMTYLLIGLHQIKKLKAQPITAEQPPLAIIIAVRNEEEDLEKALQSVCNINYQNHRIIVVNDRSTDRTAEILAGFDHPRMKLITLDELPHGWLGKNNALYQGYKNSTEEWMLFTDADIEFHPDAISRAFGYVEKHNLDHLSVLPDVRSRSVILNSVLATFSMMLMMLTRPWDAKKPRRSGSLGVGAFNLVKRTAYEQAGTHVKIKLRPDDDLKLGQNIKRAGLRQDVLSGGGYICLEWYKSLQQFRNGLLKNSFSVGNYNAFRTVADVTATLLTTALPIPVMLIFGDTAIRLMACLVLAAQVFFMSVNPRNKWWYALMIPYAGFLMAYILAKSACVTLKQGGIYWRESFYSLAMLRGEEE